MITKIKKIIFLSLFAFVAIILTSCNDEWDTHYKNRQTGVSGTSIAEYINSQSELSIFKTMLIISGYDSILNKPQSYTVWAPNNNALEGVDLTNATLVKDIVENHITRHSCPSSLVLPGPKYIQMINKKVILFSHDNSGLTFGNKLITTPDILVTNGIVHIINGYLPFQPNIYEFIKRTIGVDSLYSYIKSQWDSTYELGSSYDTTFIYTNRIFQEIGDLSRESTDSAYTVILPTNTAWNYSYSKIKDYYVSAHQTMALEIQQQFTKQAIVKDLVFRNRIYNPSSMDSLVSTTGSVFKTPGYLFSNTSLQEVSNGLVYVTDTLHYKATSSWAKTIKVEAEESSGRSNLNSNVLNRYSYGSGFPVSKSRYIYVEPTTTSTISKVYVDFSIPYTLAAKYNIYCVFIPTSIEDITDLRPFRALFYISYLSSNAIDMVKLQEITPSNNITNTNDTTKMLIASGFSFPFSHISPDERSDQIVKIRVQNDVRSGADEQTYSRAMRIDCIILEPVVE